jgi:hypothetical protein
LYEVIPCFGVEELRSAMSSAKLLVKMKMKMKKVAEVRSQSTVSQEAIGRGFAPQVTPKGRERRRDPNLFQSKPLESVIFSRSDQSDTSVLGIQTKSATPHL